ncbi:hypothetical protein HJFPF1_08426 [Paramyrothecium foliicola]|nr:hypothetical protein HJFPF1_08426 [Paramyrothecium foliicola]
MPGGTPTDRGQDVTPTSIEASKPALVQAKEMPRLFKSANESLEFLETTSTQNTEKTKNAAVEVTEPEVAEARASQNHGIEVDFDELEETRSTASVDRDLTIDTVLDGELPTRRVTPRLRRVVSSGQFDERVRSPDRSFASSDDNTVGARQSSITMPKRRIRIDSLQPPPTARRTLSSESTLTTVGRRTSGQSKNLPIEERIVKTHATLEDLQYTCSLPTTRERVTIQDVFNLIDKIRMRQVPHQWSLVDRRLKQVQSSAERIESFIGLVKDKGSDAEAAASMFFACCELSLQGDILGSAALDGLLGIFHRASGILEHVRTSVPAGVFSEQLYFALSKIIQVLQHICVNYVDMLEELKRDNNRGPAAFTYHIEQYFEKDLRSLTMAADDACQELWHISLKSAADPSLDACFAEVLDWLHGHSPQKRAWGFARGHAGQHGHGFVFDCVEPVVTKLFKATSRLLLVTGETGYGEQTMLSNLIQRLQLSFPPNTKLLSASIGSSHKGAHSATRFVRALLQQLLDQFVGDTDMLASINRVMKRSEDETSHRTEDLLWELLAEQCSKDGGNIAIIVDGGSGTDGTSVACQSILIKLQELTSKSARIRCLALAEPDAARVISGAEIYALSPSDVRRNARQFLQGAIAASTTLSSLSTQVRRELIRHVTERQWTSILEAKLILRLLESEHDLARMPDIICKTPKTVHGIVDHMILKIDYKQPELQALLSWLLVGGRAIQVSEMERYGPIAVSNWLRRIRSGRSVSSNSSLAGIITVQNGYVRFVDSLVKARMNHMSLHGKIPLSLHAAHRQVAVDCLKHAGEHLSSKKTELVFQDPSRSKWAFTSSYSEFDEFLVYSVSNWYDHYEKSLTSSEKLSGHIPAEVSSKLPDSVMMALAEWHFLRARAARSSLDAALAKVFALRKSVLGAKAVSVIQTMIIRAHVEKPHSSSAKINLERLVEAFECTILAYGDPSPQATAGARYIISALNPHTALPSKGFRVYEYLWSVDRRELGESHDKTLLIAQRLAELYTAEMRFAEAAEILHDIYEACCRTRGLFANKTLDLFHLLVDALEHSGNMTEAQRLCQDLFDAAPTLETWNECVLSAVCRIVRHHHERGMSDVSRARLKQLWVLLQSQFDKGNSKPDLIVAFTSISLHLATMMHELSLEKEASSTLKAFWKIAVKYVTTDRRCDLGMLVKLREIAQLLLRLEQHRDALGILQVVYEIHQLPSHDHFEEMLAVYSALITCYRQAENPIEDFLWLNILDSILATASSSGRIGSDTVFLCRDLATLHRSRSQHKTAISICQKSLQVLWPQVLVVGEVKSVALPKHYARECVQLIVIMVQMCRDANEQARADHFLRLTLESCKRHVLEWSSSSQEIASILSQALEEAELSLEALNFWKSILGECKISLGGTHHFTLKVASSIVRLSLKAGLNIEEDEHVCGVLDVEPDEDDLESISLLIEGLLALCKSHGGSRRNERSTELLKWYERLWSYYFDLRHDLAMDTARGFEIFHGYSDILVSMNSISTAVRLARRLRAILLSDFGKQDVWYLKACLELSKLLEMDDTTMREAVDMYDEVNEVALGLSNIDDAFVAILRLSQHRLSILVSSKPCLHERAENILVKAWRFEIKKHGHAHKNTMSCLQKLLDFCISIATVDAKQKAEDILREAVLGVIAKEFDPVALSRLAEQFYDMYRKSGFGYERLGFLTAVRAQILRPKQEKLCGQAYLQSGNAMPSYDRRCLVLVYSMEALFQSSKRDTLLSDAMTRVLAESCLYEAWLRACLAGDRLGDLLSTGSGLIAHLESCKLVIESREIQQNLWTLFCKMLGQSEKKSTSTYTFFQDVLEALRQDEISLSLLETALATIQDLTEAGNLRSCLLLSEWIYSCGQARADMDDGAVSVLYLRLSTVLYSCSEKEKTKLGGELEALATRIGVLAMSHNSNLDLSLMSLSYMRLIMRIAGKQNDFQTLKKIYELLWTSRNSYEFHLTPATTVSIGKRLAEVHFACGEHETAFALLEDITYNLKDVYGVSHPMSLDCQRLLASMHEKLGHRKSAIDIRVNLLRGALWDHEADGCGHGSVDKRTDSIGFYIEQLRSLRCGYASTDDHSWHLEQNMDCLEDITAKVKLMMQDSDADHSYDDLLNLEVWKNLTDFEVDEEVFDTWSAPDDWAVDMDMEEDCDESSWSVTDA